MVRLRSRWQCPVNGFQFVDAAISPTPLKTWDFNSMVREVMARRAANPRFKLTTDANAIAAEVDEQNALRMLSIANADSYISVEGPAPPNFTQPRSRAWQSAAAISAGAGTLVDWLGEGAVPVAKEQAEKRAAICAECPQNGKGDWLSIFTKPAQAIIQAQLSMRKDLDLSTASDEVLGVCNACKCPLKLKVHVPLTHIAAHMNDEVRAKLDGKCWITAESA